MSFVKCPAPVPELIREECRAVYKDMLWLEYCFKFRGDPQKYGIRLENAMQCLAKLERILDIARGKDQPGPNGEPRLTLEQRAAQREAHRAERRQKRYANGRGGDRPPRQRSTSHYDECHGNHPSQNCPQFKHFHIKWVNYNEDRHHQPGCNCYGGTDATGRQRTRPRESRRERRERREAEYEEERSRIRRQHRRQEEARRRYEEERRSSNRDRRSSRRQDSHSQESRFVFRHGVPPPDAVFVGFDETGLPLYECPIYPPQGFHPQGFPPQGFPPQGPGFPPQGFPPQGFPPQGFPPQGFPPQGHPHQGFPPQGFPPQGFPPQGFPPQGYPPQGFPPQGFPPQGYPPQGYPAPRPEYQFAEDDVPMYRRQSTDSERSVDVDDVVPMKLLEWKPDF